MDARTIAVFCEQVSLILGSNISLEDGVHALAQSEERGGIFGKIEGLLQESGSFSSAVEACGMFPVYMTGMVRVAEETGEMERVMRGLATHYHREATIRRQIASAIRYPLTLVAIMSLVIVVLVLRVLPVFEQAFRSLGGTAADVAMMRMGQRAGLAVFSVMTVMMVAAVVLGLLLRGGRNPALRRALCGRIPMLRSLQKKRISQRFASVFSMVLASGFPFEMALDLVPIVFDDEQTRALMRSCGERVIQGEAVPTVIEEAALFEPLDMQMIRAGFASGQADVAFERIASRQTQEIEEILQRMVAWMEPVLVVFLGAMIGAILLAVMMPLAGVLSAMGG